MGPTKRDVTVMRRALWTIMTGGDIPDPAPGVDPVQHYALHAGRTVDQVYGELAAPTSRDDPFNYPSGSIMRAVWIATRMQEDFERLRAQNADRWRGAASSRRKGGEVTGAKSHGDAERNRADALRRARSYREKRPYHRTRANTEQLISYLAVEMSVSQATVRRYLRGSGTK